MSTTLVLGGARSGKSRFAEGLARGECHYLATSQAFDDEMRARIATHRQDRGALWVTHEEPLALTGTLADIDAPGRFVLVDCLTLWLSNVLLAGQDWQAATDDLAAMLPRLQASVVLVSNEVGMGLVPETPLGRAFRDAQGILNQRMAAIANNVFFVAAGLPLALKGRLPE
ncbi:MAG: bifunctional adenosylcobinamide kinase/adenosylcobinamide-phosphate guanylyltransferase [Proteobacteria bacterium]|nr:bifunctional adenosylcobinamide kinase/adenosylcobinamide-phosphate guanylyltransferase [Pseudomonadota bacterium]